MGGALLALVVAVVIFIGLVIWYTVHPGEIEAEQLSGLEAVHQLATACHDRHPQLAGTPAGYLEKASALASAGEPPWRELLGLYCKTLAVDPDSGAAVVGWVEAAAHRADLADPAPGQLQELLAAVERLAPDTAGLDRARAAVTAMD